MYDFIMPYQLLIKNFDVYETNREIDNLKIYSIVAKNDDIKPYMKNIIFFCYEYEFKRHIQFVLDEITDKLVSFDEEEILVFRFNDEEEAFYFKLKFTS